MTDRPAGDFTIVENIVAGFVTIVGVALLAVACLADMTRTRFGSAGR
ncbi:hypothetical protein SFC76_03145 [Sphingomonas sp. CD22]|nr:hypothetical protein [Sphingomonas sp. CD22]MEA1083245.1 hypothetical protein [Sphingomonas sp. CD22]